MKNEKSILSKKRIAILCSVVAVVSTIIFIPQIRELIMMFGDRIARKTIDRNV